MAEAARPSHESPGVDAMAEGGCTGENFVERHRVELIKRVSNIKPILDELLRQEIISRYSYDQMKPLPTSQEKMAELFRWPLPVSGGEGKEMFYKLLEEHEPHLIDELRRKEEPVEAGMPVRELLLETLHHLRDKEMKKFNWLLLWKFSLCGFPRHLWHRLQSLHTAENLVDVMVQTWGQKSVEVTKEVLVDMNRTDLVQRLHTWGHKEEHSLGELWPGLIPEVETMASAIELLLETLKDLTDGELEKFKDSFLKETQDQKITSDIRWLMSEATDVQDVVFVMVLTYGHLSVWKTETFLHEMNRIDLVQYLSHSSSGPQKKLSSEHRPALILRAARKAAVRRRLWEIEEDFSDWEKFKKILPLIISQNNPFSLMLRRTSVRESVVDLMLQTFGLHSLDLTCEVLEIMGRSHTICEVKASGRERETVGERAQDEHQAAQSESTMTSVQESILEALKDLNDKDLKKFNHHLQCTPIEKSFLRIPRQRLKTANRVEMVKLMMEAYLQQSVEVIREMLKRMYWEDLQESGLGTRLRLQERRWYRTLQSESTMTSVTESLLETLEDLNDEDFKKFKHHLQYTKVEKSFLRIPRQRLETVDRVEMVKLMMEAYDKQSVEVTREMLKTMYWEDLQERWSRTYLETQEAQTLSAQIESTMTSVQESILEALDGLKDEDLKKFKHHLQFTPIEKSFLRIPSQRLETVDRVEMVKLMMEAYLQQSVEVIREVLKRMYWEDPQERGSTTYIETQGENFVERHRVELIKRVSNIKPILDELLRQKIISRYSYDQMKPLPTSQEKMAELFRWPLPVSGGEGKEMFYKLLEEHEPHLIDELRRTEEPVEAGMPVRELLLETLHHLRDKEMKKFNWLLLWKFSLCGFPRHLWHRLQSLHTAENLVDVMVQTWGQKSVEVTKEVLVDMNRTDLVQRLHTWGHKEEHSLGELWPGLIPEVETMASAIELLLETLKDLTDGELEKFKDSFLKETQDQKITSDIRWLMSEATDVQDVVFVMVLTYGHLSVWKTETFLHEMNRIDLVQYLSHSSSGPQKKLSSEHRPALIQRAARKAAVRHLLWEIEEDFSDWEKFKKILPLIISQNNPFSLMLRRTSVRESVVDLMLQTLGLHSLDLTCEVLEIMGRSFTICEVKASGRERETVGERAQHQAAQSESTRTSVQESLLEALKDLNDEDLEKFKHHLQYTEMEKGFIRIPRQRLETADRVEMVKLMMEAYLQQSVEVTREVLKRMYWVYLHERWPRRVVSQGPQTLSTQSILARLRGPPRPSHETSRQKHSGITVPDVVASIKRVVIILRDPSVSESSDSVEGGSLTESSEWTKLDPEVNSQDADDAPTYSLQSEAGNYECSISGLRWICNGKVRFKYQFCPWEEPMERMESLQYMPAGPLMDITVVAGKLDEVYLPHWICIDDNPKILDKFAVLHIDDCGDNVENVSQVTASHVKLSEPVFSPRAVLLRIGIPVRINCNVLLYKTNTAFLTLHVYLIPRDPGLQQEMDRRQISDGYKVIKKPHPNTSLKMNDRFILNAVLKGSEIIPENLKLQYDSRSPNFFEVYSKNPDTDFELVLKHKKDHRTVWNCTIRKDEYQSIGHTHAATPSAGAAGVNTTARGGSAGSDFVDEHRAALIDRVNNVAPILDDLLAEGVVSEDIYKKIRRIALERDQMTELYFGPLKAAGRAGKEVFYKSLQKNEEFLMDDL
ncbi:uncharacterized protein LOC134132856 isoform X2 [Pungitius pungitius]|uniref:uncharacterized protein LOC134132856 isoform X2 n=1 Tax=Pungitius pungitius TaxID=134920 RepID=UPI002E12819D